MGVLMGSILNMKKRILILGAGREQCIAIEEAKQLGLYVIACDENQTAPGLKLADVGVVVDIKDPKKITALGREHGVSGIFCHAVEIPEVVADVAEALDLPGLSPQTARLCKSKHDRIRALKSAGVKVPDFIIVSHREELEREAAAFGFPFVIKPLDNAGSRGVQLVADHRGLMGSYNEAMLYTDNPSVILERYLQGPQVSTESVVYQGCIKTFAFADRNYGDVNEYAPHFIEDGINFPSVLAEDIQRRVLAEVNKAIEVLGIDFGAAKGDVLIHDGVPYIVEMASRTSGGWFGAGSIPIATGVNPLKPLIQMSVGEHADMGCLVPTRRLWCAQRYWIPKGSAIFNSVDGINLVGSMPGVAMFTDFFPESGVAIDKARNHAQRYAQVICTGSTRDEAILRAEAAIASLRVELTPL